MEDGLLPDGLKDVIDELAKGEIGEEQEQAGAEGPSDDAIEILPPPVPEGKPWHFARGMKATYHMKQRRII